MQESDIEAEHRSKENIAHVDALSRIPVEKVVKTLEKLVEDRLEILTGIEELDFVRNMQYSTPELQNIIIKLKN